MAIRIVRLGQPREAGEGLRIGTVRRPPRGVRSEDLAAQDWYDVWYPNLAPDAELVKQARSATDDKDWAVFVRRFRKALQTPESRHNLGLLAALSAHVDFSVGCYCEDESRCHRSVLREVLSEYGAVMR